jgi:hypothetical protein
MNELNPVSGSPGLPRGIPEVDVPGTPPSLLDFRRRQNATLLVELRGDRTRARSVLTSSAPLAAAA